MVLSGSEDRTVVVWQLADNSASLTYKVCIGYFFKYSFEIRSVRVGILIADKLIVYFLLIILKGHQSALQVLLMMSDGRRAMSGDRARTVHVWLVDSGIVLLSANCPTTSIDVTLNMKFAVIILLFLFKYIYEICIF